MWTEPSGCSLRVKSKTFGALEKKALTWGNANRDVIAIPFDNIVQYNGYFVLYIRSIFNLYITRRPFVLPLAPLRHQGRTT